ncbi:hypothetical protein TKK_0002854 [Trichogramma kaykai]|uniref:Uncharacterized protein n=1 Tax=Trichogramma kaykai TaxID=54128 RepID=A0ABD2XQ47_9HYME
MGDARRFSIYLEINPQFPHRIAWKVKNLVLQDYLRLKYNDAWTWTFCSVKFAIEDTDNLYRSIDGVDFSLIQQNDGNFDIPTAQEIEQIMCDIEIVNN